MDKITLRNTLPNVFSTHTNLQSDVWLNDISFDRGSLYLIEANSGTGKSSLCSYIYGYRADYSGSILFDDKDIRSLKLTEWNKIRCSELGILFQELCLFSELTAWENVQLKNNLTGFKTTQQIEEMFDKLGVADKKDAKIGKMSWGQQQRVAVIRSLCQPFSFLILDEPISHLDDSNAQIMADLLSMEAFRQGAAILATSIGKQLPLSYTKTLAL